MNGVGEGGERDQSASALIYYDGIYTLLSLTSRKQLDYHLLSLTPKNTWHGHDFPRDLEGFLICKNNGWRRRVDCISPTTTALPKRKVRVAIYRLNNRKMQLATMLMTPLLWWWFDSSAAVGKLFLCCCYPRLHDRLCQKIHGNQKF